MKTILKLCLALLLVALANGCASTPAGEHKKANSGMESPTDNSGTEIHGHISTSVGGRIK